MRNAGPAPADRGNESGARPATATPLPGRSFGLPAVPWTGRDVLRGILFLFIAIGLLLIVLAIIIRRGGERPTGWELALSTVLTTALTEALLIVVAVAIVTRRGATWGQLGFRPFPFQALVQVGSVILIGFSVNLVYALAIQTLGLERFSPPSARDLLPLFGEGGWGLAIGLVLAGVIAPLAEEMFFRGFVFTGLLRPLGFTGALIVSSLVFAVVHLQVMTILPIFVLGCLLAWLYYRSGSLWPSILVHATYNSVALLAAFFAVSQT